MQTLKTKFKLTLAVQCLFSLLLAVSLLSGAALSLGFMQPVKAKTPVNPSINKIVQEEKQNYSAIKVNTMTIKTIEHNRNKNNKLLSNQQNPPRWTLYGGPGGGVPMHFAFSPNYSNDCTLFSRSYGDVFRSTDCGDSWHVVLAGLGMEGHERGMASIDVSPNYINDHTVFLVDYGLGVYKSTQNGAVDTWTRTNFGLTNLNAFVIKISPNYVNDATVFVGTENGVYRSTDMGLTWEQIITGLSNLEIRSITISPNYANDQTLFVGTRSAGVYRSTNGGNTWVQKSSSIGNRWIRHLAISTNYSNDQTLFAGADGYIYKSVDGGETWTQKNYVGSSGVHGLSLSPDYANDQTVFVSNCYSSVQRSTNGGDTWSTVGGGVVYPCWPVVVSPNYPNDQTVFVGGDTYGVYRSTNGGSSWTMANNGFTGLWLQSIDLSPNYNNDSTLFGATVYRWFQRSTDRGQTWQIINNGVTGSDSHSISVSPNYTIDQTVFGGTWPGGVHKTVNGGNSWSRPGLSNGARCEFSPNYAQDQIVICSAGGIQRSADNGTTWIKVVDTGGDIAFSPNFINDQTVFVSLTEQGVWRSTDGGITWGAINSGITDTLTYNIEISPYYAIDQTVFAVNTEGLVFKTTNGGNSWQFQGQFTLTLHYNGTKYGVLAISPNYATDQTLYAADRGGMVYVSHNDGVTWQSMNNGFEAASNVYDFEFIVTTQSITLLAARMGGIWQYPLTPPPTLTTLTPPTAVANTGNLPVVIKGTNLQTPLTATLGGITLLTTTLENPSTLHAVVPVELLGEGHYTLTVQSRGYTLTLPTAFTVTPAISPTQFRAMVYMACDNNLESSCLNLFNQLELAMVTNPDLRITVFMDGAANGDSAYYLIQADNNIYARAVYTDGLNRFPLGEVDSAYVGTLVEFANWAHAQYPGHYTFLSLVGHGGGWGHPLYPGQGRGYDWGGGIGGMLWDDTNGNVLDTKGLAQALQWLTLAGPVDALFLDACLMGNVEVLAEVAPYAHYTLAPENLIWATYPYANYLQGINQSTTPLGLVQHIAHINHQSWPDIGHPSALTVFDNAQISPLLATLDTFSVVLSNTLLTEQSLISQTILSSSHMDENQDWFLSEADAYIDLKHFGLQLLSLPAISPSLQVAAQNLITAIDAAVVVNYTLSGTPWPGSTWWNLDNLHGPSIYFPLVDEWRRPFYTAQSLPTFATATHWDDLVQQWHIAQPAPPVPTTTCSNCPIPPMGLSLQLTNPPKIAGGSQAAVGQVTYWPIRLNDSRLEDDVRGVQLSVHISDPNLLSPATNLNPRLGPAIPSASYSYTVSTADGWDFLLSLPLAPSQAIHGSQIVVELPFYAHQVGCVTATFSTTLLSNGAAQLVNHHAISNTLCISNKGGVTGNVYLQSRPTHTATNVLLSNGQISYTTTTDANGNFNLPAIEAGVYTATFSKWLFVQGVRLITVTSGQTSTLHAGLWAGDINSDVDVDDYDWFLLAAAAIPVYDPAFDLNLDGTTDVRDSTILNCNINRVGMPTSNPPVVTPECPLTLRHYPQSVALNSFNLSNLDTSAQDSKTQTSCVMGAGSATPSPYMLKAVEFSGSVQAIGGRISLATGAIVRDVVSQGSFGNGYLHWHQVDNTLYIVAAPPEGSTFSQDSTVAIVYIQQPQAGNVCIAADNLVGDDVLGGHLIFSIAKTVYLPLIVR